MHRPFRNEPLTDFSIRENREAFEGALARVEHQLGRTWPLRIGGVEIDTEQKITSVNPSRPAQVIGHVGKASAAQAEQAIAAAKEAFKTWSHTPAQARARILWRAAAIMRRRKHELSAWMVKEVAKTWVEADADTAEAIDFLDFYGREACRLAEKQPLAEHPSEDNNLYYIPLGVGAVIPPWNFPCAIMAGMTTAAAVAGNTVVLKPASTAPV
ncbi:MAG: aldehyde dehydrogenase family protein, partial [Planctomycetota bacterium]